MERRKGLELPISIIVIIGIAVLVLAIVAVFFLSIGGTQMTVAQAEAIFQQKCRAYCDTVDTNKNLQTAVMLQGTPDTEFMTACKTLGVDVKESEFSSSVYNCMKACSSRATSCEMPDQDSLNTALFESRNSALDELPNAP